MPHHFQDGRYRKAYEEFVAISQVTKSPPDSTTWEHRLIAISVSTNDNFLLATIYQQIPIELVIPSSIEVYAGEIIKEWKRTNLLSLANKMQEKLVPGSDVDAIRQETEQAFFDISTNAGQSTNMVDMPTALVNLNTYQDKRDRGEIPLVKTGLTAFDELVGDMEGGQFIALCGRPKMGKTSLMVFMLRYWSKNGVPSVMFQLEMSANEIVQRLIALESGIPLREIRERKFIDKDSPEKYWLAQKEIAKWPIHIDDRAGVTIRYIEAESRRLKMKKGIQVAIVDHLGKIRSEKKSDDLYITVTDSSGKLKELAKNLNIPTIAGVQLSRRLEERGDKRPRASDARDSGHIEQDVDLMIGVYRDEVYSPETETPGIMELSCMAGRSAAMGEVNIGWDGTRSMVYNL